MNSIQFHNPGVLINKLPEKIFLELKEPLIQNYKNIFLSKSILDCRMFDGLESFIHQIYTDWCLMFNETPKPISINDLWVNYMRREEYSPMHNHKAPIVFVIWIKIPYNNKDEQLFNSKSIALNKNGNFEFAYSMLTGQVNTHRIILDQEMEGSLIMFPGSIHHIVYPFFSCDDVRISVVGNIHFS
jgi:hypothetical protein